MKRRFIHSNRLPSTAALIALLILSTGCLRKRDYVAINKESLKSSAKLYFVPLGDFSATTVNELASFYRNKYKLNVEILPAVPLPAAAINPERQQLIAEEVIEMMKQASPSLKNDASAILIGLTSEDMYIARFDWRFSFSYRDQGKYAVVSTGRMNLPKAGRFKLPIGGREPASEELILTRLRKMVTKNIGILLYHLPQSDDPRSVLYRNVGGISELDRMGEEF